MLATRVVLDNVRNRIRRWRHWRGPSRIAAVAMLACGAVGIAGVTTCTHPAGWVQVKAGETDIGAPAALTRADVATTAAAIAGNLPSAGSVTAYFMPATTAYLASATTAAAQEDGGTSGTGGSIPITFTVPPGGAGSGGTGTGGTGSGGTGPPGSTGDFTVTVRPGTVTLQNVGQSGFAIGMLQSVTVSETRSWAPGWSVRGQESDFIGRRSARKRIIPGTYLGWIPTGTPATGAALGQAVHPGSPGIGDAGPVLAAADPGSGVGTSILGAFLTLAIPASAGIGPYAGLLTITYVESTSLRASSGPGQLPQAG